MSLIRKARAIYDDFGIWALAVSAIKYAGRSILVFVGCVLGSVLPRQTGLVLFHNKCMYQGNSRYLYDWMREHNEQELDLVWITHSARLYMQLQRKNKPVVYTYSPRGLYYFARAAVFCYDEQQYERFPDSVEVFCVKHEIPVKRGQMNGTKQPKQDSTQDSTDYDGGQMNTSNESSESFSHEYIFDHVLYPSEFLVTDSLLSPDVNVVTLGFPRNDYLLTVADETQNRWKEYLAGFDPELVILYAPSRRRFTYDSEIDLFPFDDFQVHSLFEFLEEQDALLLLRLHPRDENNASTYPTRHGTENLQLFIDTLTQHERIRYAGTNDFAETTEIMPFVDTLITDYSTTYHTFLLLDRPMLFFPYDFEIVYETEGFKYDYYEKLPGPAIDTFEEFQEYLRDLANGIDAHQESRHHLRDELYNYHDAQACKRVAAYIETLALKG